MARTAREKKNTSTIPLLPPGPTCHCSWSCLYFNCPPLFSPRPGLPLWLVPPYSSSPRLSSRSPGPACHCSRSRRLSCPFPLSHYPSCLFLTSARLAIVAGPAVRSSSHLSSWRLYCLPSFLSIYLLPCATPRAPAAMGDPK